MNCAFTVFLALQHRIYSISVLNTIPRFLTILQILNSEEDCIEMPNLIKRENQPKMSKNIFLLISFYFNLQFILFNSFSLLCYLFSFLSPCHSFLACQLKLFQFILFNLCTCTVLTKTRYQAKWVERAFQGEPSSLSKPRDGAGFILDKKAYWQEDLRLGVKKRCITYCSQSL